MKYPIPEIPDDSEKKSGTDWVLPKIIGSGRVSGTRQALVPMLPFECLSVSVVALSIASCMPSGRGALDVRAASQLF